MRLDWCGRPTTRKSADFAFNVVVGCYFTFLVVRYSLAIYTTKNATIALNDPSNIDLQKSYQQALLLNVQNALDLVFLIYTILLMCRSRRAIRSKYAIPTTCCGECEDCCCSYWCGCCTVGQMARHTADYHVYSASCCSKTGLPSHAPEIV